jgi:hypothetical protein
VFRSPTGIRLPADCLMNDDGKSATVLALRGKSGAPAAAGHTQAAAPAGHHPGGKPAADPKTPAHQAAGGHHPTAGTLEALQISLAARGEEGAASLDTRLAGRDLVCASPDILARLAAGAPFQIRAGK